LSQEEEEEAVPSALALAKEWHDASLARTQVRLPFPPSLPPSLLPLLLLLLLFFHNNNKKRKKKKKKKQ